MKIFSIQNRLIFLALLIIGAFLIQNSIIINTTESTQDLEYLRRQYVSLDSQVVEALLEVDEAVSHYALRIDERFLSQMLFFYEVNEEADRETFINFRSSLDDVEKLLEERNTLAYQMNVDPETDFQLTGYNVSKINDLADIMDTSSTGAYKLLLKMQNDWEQEVYDQDNYSLGLTNQRFAAAQSYADAAHPLGNQNKGYIGNYTNLFRTITNQLNATNQADTNYTSYLLPVINHMEDTYNAIIDTWSDIQIVGFTQNVSDTAYVPHELDELDETVDDAIVDMALYNSQLANITVLPAEQTLIDQVNDLFTNYFVPTMRNVTVSLSLIHDIEVNIRSFIVNDWEILADNLRKSLTEIKRVVNGERGELNDRFGGIITSINTQVNGLLSTLTNVTLMVLVVVIGTIVVQMSISFRLIGSKFSKVADGDLTFKSKSSYARTELGELEEHFDNVVEQLRGALSTIQITSERLSGIAEELAAGSEEASSSVKEVSDTMREFSGGASEQNIMLSRINQKLQEHLTDVERSSSRIGETSSFVLKVAKRTNILGLNASIEAAKAGRYGRGFNVVAEEVRGLSDTTKSSANQIAEIIEDVQYSISKAVEDILREVNVVKEVAENTAAGSEEVNAAAMEQVTMLGEISDTSSELAHLAQDLNNLIQKFQIQ